MNGIEIAKEAFFTRFLPKVPENLLPCFSAGLVGNGSECFGYDDDLSRDHDFDGGFCVWVDDAAFDAAFPLLDGLYRDAMRFSPYYSPVSRGAERRRGIFKTSDFYLGLLGLPGAPKTPAEWLSLPDYALAAATNGVVFTETATDFTYIRNSLCHGLPRDVLLKKLAKGLLLAAQAGQYNFPRCLKHGEPAAARLALSEFVSSFSACVYYLNRRFPPYYKWLLRGMKNLPTLGSTGEGLSALLLTQDGEDCASGAEALCASLLSELRARGLTEGEESYLEPHAFRVKEKISNPKLRALHILL